MINDVTSPDTVLSILIVNFNGKEFLKPCFESIHQHIKIPFEIIIVDNASHDGSVGYIEQNYPSVSIIKSPVNIGFTGGNNLAAKAAKGRYLLLLNNDTVICTAVNPLVELMDSNPKVGALGCRLMYGDGRQQESAGYMPSALSLAMSWTPFAVIFPQSSKFRRTVHADSPLYKKTYSEVDWVSGAFLLTRTDLWRQLHGLDEHYFMYMEDTDYCRRVGEAGHQVVYTSTCQVIHFEGAGRPWIGERAVLNTTNSYMIYLKKFYGTFAVVTLRVLLSQVFVLRSLSHFMASVLGMDTNGHDKSTAYRRAALNLILGRAQCV